MNWTPQIETARLTLRAYQESDYENWRVGYLGRLPQQHPYDSGQEDISHCDQAWFSNLCQRHQQAALEDKSYCFGVFSRTTNQHFGNIDLVTLRREENQWAILGYEIHNQYWQKGLGKEAVRAVLICGFTHLNYHRIEAQINLDNQASIALAKSVGMQLECIRRGFIYENQQWIDHWIYAAIPSDLEISEKPPN